MGRGLQLTVEQALASLCQTYCTKQQAVMLLSAELLHAGRECVQNRDCKSLEYPQELHVRECQSLSRGLVLCTAGPGSLEAVK